MVKKRQAPKTISELDVVEIMSHKPDPKKKSMAQLAKQFKVTPSIIRGIWNRGTLPTAASYKRRTTIPVKLKAAIEKDFDDERAVIGMAEEYRIVQRVLLDYQKKWRKKRDR